MNETIERPICEAWTDHEWSAPRFLDNGTHPVKGAYQRFVTTCERCGRRTAETRWINVVGLPEARQ